MKNEVKTCAICGRAAGFEEVDVAGKRYDACEECVPNVHRILDLLKAKYKVEIQIQEMKRHENFVSKMVKETIAGRYKEKR